jgi:hypothetical protein
MCDLLMASGELPSLNGRQAHLTVIVREVEGGGRVESELEGVGAIPESIAAKLFSEGSHRVLTVERGSGVVLDYGRRRRVFNERQREVAAAVRETCSVRGCRWPVAKCQMHHDDEFGKGGGTDLRNGYPLCTVYHHPLVTKGLRKMVPQADGSVVLMAPDSS